MKTLKVLATCVALVTLPVVIESCCLVAGPGSCGCGSYKGPQHFDIKSMAVSTISRAGIGAPSQLDPPSPGPLNTLAFYILMDAEYRALIHTSHATMAAYACSPPDPVADQKITSIRITSNNRLTTPGGVYDAGLDLSDLFLLTVYESVADIDAIVGTELYTTALYVVSDEAVDVEQTHKFTITITLDDGRIFELVTEDAELTPN